MKDKKQIIRANGKLLLSAEYFILDGAKAIALPCQLGQIFSFEKIPNQDSIVWKSFDHKKQLWFEGIFNKKNLNIVSSNHEATAQRLTQILQAVQHINPRFLKEEEGLTVESHLEFPRIWGLGTSSTLIYSIAQWAQIDPFILLEKTFGGSGYDIACAGVKNSISYQIIDQKPVWEKVNFNPQFTDQIYFIFLGKKQNSREGIQHYRATKKSEDLVQKFSTLSKNFLEAQSLIEFENYIEQHETLISSTLNLPKVKELYFSDFWGKIKSLGAWGGDFVLATSDKTEEETKQYFNEKGFDVFLKYSELILEA